MEGELVKILKKFRDEEDPDMGSLDGKSYETLSKSECLDELKKYGIDSLELCRLGNINPLPESLCKLAYFAGVTCPASERSGTGENSEDKEPPSKKKKKAEAPTVRTF